MDVDQAENIKCAFVDCANMKVMDESVYIAWSSGYQKELPKETKKICDMDIVKISMMATLMTKDEVLEFMKCDYTKCLPEQKRNTLDDEIER